MDNNVTQPASFTTILPGSFFSLYEYEDSSDDESPQKDTAVDENQHLPEECLDVLSAAKKACSDAAKNACSDRDACGPIFVHFIRTYVSAAFKDENENSGKTKTGCVVYYNDPKSTEPLGSINSLEVAVQGSKAQRARIQNVVSNALKEIEQLRKHYGFGPLFPDGVTVRKAGIDPVPGALNPQKQAICHFSIPEALLRQHYAPHQTTKTIKPSPSGEKKFLDVSYDFYDPESGLSSM